jgi:aldehyde dehydrogenase (NAD+)
MQQTIDRIFDLQLKKHPEIRVSTADQRITRLQKLKTAIFEKRSDLEKALYADLRRGPSETALTELYPVTSEIKHAAGGLKEWMKPVRVKNPLTFVGARGEVIFEPKGVVLILAPWNFPFQLAIGPLVSAIAAGNCVMLKPSEISENTSHFIRDLISSTFPEDEVAVVEGGPDVSQMLLEKPFHHIFFTGSSAVGKIVMQAAAKHLASVTLELGGKSPVILHDSCDVKDAARKIVWGKLLNAGQLCIAPDYVLVPETKQAEFVEQAKAAMAEFYGKPESSPDYCRIISDRHFKRLRNLIDEAVTRGARIEVGGATEDASRYIAPTILTHVPQDAGIMKEEIFGPVLPVLTYHELSEAISMINSGEKPLALYIFSKSKAATETLLAGTSAGGTCINDVVVQYVNLELPFGGVNFSGFGNSHGFYGFRAFSHQRAVLRQPKRGAMQLLYPPYTDRVKKMIELTIKWF